MFYITLKIMFYCAHLISNTYVAIYEQHNDNFSSPMYKESFAIAGNARKYQNFW